MKALVPTILILFTTPVYAAGFWDLCNQPSISISSHSPSKDLLLSGLCPNSQGAYIHSAVFLQDCFVNVNGTLFDKQRYSSPTPAEYEKAKQEIGKERRKKQFRDDCQDCRLNIIHGLKTQWETEAEVPMMACMCRIVSMDGEVGWSEAKVDLETVVQNRNGYLTCFRSDARKVLGGASKDGELKLGPTAWEDNATRGGGV